MIFCLSRVAFAGKCRKCLANDSEGQGEKAWAGTDGSGGGDAGLSGGVMQHTSNPSASMHQAPAPAPLSAPPPTDYSDWN